MSDFFLHSFTFLLNFSALSHQIERKRSNISPPDVGSVKSTFNYRSVNGLFSVDIPQCVLHEVTTEVSLIMSISLPLSVKLVHCKMRNITYFAEATSCRVEQVEEGHFKVLLNPEQPGLHELSVCVGEVDAHIHGSPFEVPVVSVAEWRGQKMKVFAGGLKQPRGLAVTDDGGYVLVTEWQGHCVAVFSAATGELLYRIGQHGTGPGEFVEPYEVEVTGDNHIFVKDEESIQKFALDGSLEDKIAILKFSNGMTVLSNGDDVLTGAQLPRSTDGSSIIKIRPKLLYLYWQGRDWFEIASPYDFDGEPADIAVDNKGRIYMLTVKYGINIFTSEGKYIDSFGRYILNNPHEFCIDSNNIIYVTDGKKVKIFNTEGRLLGSFGNHSKLRGIAVCKTTGDLYVSKASGEVYVSRNT